MKELMYVPSRASTEAEDILKLAGDGDVNPIKAAHRLNVIYYFMLLLPIAVFI